MTWLTDTIAGRTMLVLVIGIGTVLTLSHAAYEWIHERESQHTNISRLAERLVFLKNTMLRLPDDQRDAVAHSLSGGPIEIHWSEQPLATEGGGAVPSAPELKSNLLAAAPEIGEYGLIIGATADIDKSHDHKKPADHTHTVLISMQLEDASWINLSQVVLQGSRLTSPSFWIAGAVLAAGTVIVSILMAYWLTHPLSNLTSTVNRLFAGVEKTAVPEVGPREIRELGAAFQAMQERIQRLISDRTQTLAAISHDLRTPLTRLRLRMEQISDEAARTSFAADLDEMEEMIEATLSFLKGEGSDEAVQAFDLVAVLETITGDIVDSGAEASLTGARTAVVHGKRLALKRALSNILHNAVKYGNRVRTNVSVEPGSVVVEMEDDGPGIPAEELHKVFEPFYRLEASRSRDTGGYGLGLTVARTIIQAHGGRLVLSNKASGGLLATVRLPTTTAC